MKKKKTIIGMVAIVVAFALNLNYANNGYGYGTIYAGGTGTYVGQYECDTDVEGHIVMCNSREATGPQFILCPYYRKTYYASVKLFSSDVPRIIKGKEFHGWSSLVLQQECENTSSCFPGGNYIFLNIWTECSSSPEPAPLTNVECQSDNNPGSRCTIIHHECSDLPTSIISAFS